MTDDMLEEVVRRAAKEARLSQAERESAEAALTMPKGATPADRNDTLLEAMLGGALPRRSPIALRRILERSLQTLYVEYQLDRSVARELLLERRNPKRSASTPVDPRVADALGYLSEILAAIEEPSSPEGAKASAAAGLSRDALLSGPVAAGARKRGGVASGTTRRVEAGKRHRDWCHTARLALKAGREPRDVASLVAKRYGVKADTVRRVLVREGVLARGGEEKRD